MNKKIIFLFLFCWAGNSFAQSKLTVNQAIEIVLKNNFDIQIQKNKSEILKTNSDASIANFLPKAGINISKSGSLNSIEQKFSNGTEASKDGVMGSNFNPQLNVSWTLFDGMKMFANKNRLKNLAAIGELNYKDTLQNLVAQTIISYYEIVSASMKLNALYDAMKIAEVRVKISEQQYLIGASSKVDWLQAKVDLNEEKSAALLQATLVNQKKIELNRLMNLPFDNAIDVIDSISFNDNLSLISEAELDKTNLQLLMAAKTKENSYLLKKEMFSNYLPQLNVSGAYGLNKNTNSAGFSLLNQSQGFSGSVSLYIPIFMGTQTQKQMKVASINQLNAEIQFKKIHSIAASKFYLAKMEYQKSITLLQFENENIELAKENLAISAERFKLGQSTAIEIRQAESSYSTAMNRLVQTKFAAKSAETELLRIMGKLVKW